jgi:putative protease
METFQKNIEIMSPVGSYESLMAAIQAKANSVYFGIENLNMRSNSVYNFTLNNLKEIVEIAHQNNIKAYLTVNTIIYDEDIELMKTIIDTAVKNNIDAIIASDMAAIEYAYGNGAEVHISTQMNISNFEAVKYFSKYCDVIVLARELNINQIKSIYNSIVREKITGPKGNLIRLELFAHGALCMSISGKCYLSLHEYNKSANRGECLQLCRRGYTVTDKETQRQLDIENEYIMSPKDLCTIDFLDKIIDAGISVLKIEGRARSPEYVKTVTECYREAVSSIREGNYNKEKIEEWKTRLSKVFNRGFWDGYYLGRRLGEWSNVYGSKATIKKVYVGKCNNYFSKIKVAEFIIETGSMKVGDKILIIGPSTGVIETNVTEIRVDYKNVDETKKGERCSIPVENTIRRNDKLYILVTNN